MQSISKEQVYKQFGANVKFIRKKLSLTQLKFGEKLGWTRSKVGSLEESRAFNIEDALRIAELSSVSLDTLLLTDMSKPLFTRILDTEVKTRLQLIKAKLKLQNDLLDEARKALAIAGEKMQLAKINASKDNF